MPRLSSPLYAKASVRSPLTLDRFSAKLIHSLLHGPERGERWTMSDFTLPDDVFFEPDLKAYEEPVKFFLYNVNAANHATGCKLDMIARSPTQLKPPNTALDS